MEELRANLRQLFSDGHPSHDSIKKVMSSCSLTKQEWNDYAKIDPTVNYTRNLVENDDNEGRFNLLVLCWNPQKGSPIHDHNESSCFLKVLEGKLEETKYDVPREGEALQLIQSTINGAGSLTYMDNSIGLHRVRNASSSEVAVSLHLYYPPLTECLKYEESGSSTRCEIKV